MGAWQVVYGFGRVLVTRVRLPQRSRSIGLFSAPLVLHVSLATFVEVPNIAYEKKYIRRGTNMLIFGTQTIKDSFVAWMQHRNVVSVVSL